MGTGKKLGKETAVEAKVATGATDEVIATQR